MTRPIPPLAMKRGFTAVALIAAALSLVGCDNVEKKAATSETANADTTKFPIAFECDVTLQNLARVAGREKVKLFVVLDNDKRGLRVTESPGEEYSNKPNSQVTQVTLTDKSLSYGSYYPTTNFIDSHSINRLTGYHESKL